MDSRLHSWAVDRPVTSQFARPRGLRGRLAGWFMLRTNLQDDVLDMLDVRSGDVVLEIGYGPGGLVRLLSRSTIAARIQGLDPSAEMREAATKLNRAAVRQGRVELSLGSADRTGLPAESVDHVVAVNNVAFWRDLDADGARLKLPRLAH